MEEPQYTSYQLSPHMLPRPHVLENEVLRVEVVPELGGRITSFRSVRTGREFMLQSLRESPGDLAKKKFSEGHIGGLDECLPSVSACGAIGSEAEVPDHGDLWRKPWTVMSETGGLLLEVDAVSRPLRLSRLASLNGDTLTLRYELRNTSRWRVTWLWCAHPLLHAEVGDRILLPRETSQVTVEYASYETVHRRTDISWPLIYSLTGVGVDLSLLRRNSGAYSYKLFARSGRSGNAILYRSSIEQGIAFYFDPAVLPFVGIWVNAGAWPGESPDERLTVALEPATCNYDSLAEAKHHGMANYLAGGLAKRWTVSLKLLGAKAPCALSDIEL